MPRTKPPILLVAGFAVTFGFLTTSSLASAASHEKILHNFNGSNVGRDGNNPNGGLVFDSAGNLYGTTFFGGTNDKGTVFELTPHGGGGWTETVLHDFNDDGHDGTYPEAGLTFDVSGNLYGTTEGGGNLSGCYQGCGTVFELTPEAGGGWTELVLYNFQDNGMDGNYPFAGVILDAVGNLYGTTSSGGAAAGYDSGTVFELTPQAGHWTETVLHSFSQSGTDGYWPYARLLFDASGNLYGTTFRGGTYGLGIVFELKPDGAGRWAETVLHNFGDSGGAIVVDGFYPAAGLILDAAGNLYSTTDACGIPECYTGCGTVFKLTPDGGGGWTEEVLHDFHGTDGGGPSGLIFDTSGNLYGTAGDGAHGAGTLFELVPTGGGAWTEKVLHNFNRNGKDGFFPKGGLIFDAAGNLYGTTGKGGTYNSGTVFEIAP